MSWNYFKMSIATFITAELWEFFFYVAYILFLLEKFIFWVCNMFCLKYCSWTFMSIIELVCKCWKSDWEQGGYEYNHSINIITMLLYISPLRNRLIVSHAHFLCIQLIICVVTKFGSVELCAWNMASIPAVDLYQHCLPCLAKGRSRH